MNLLDTAFTIILAILAATSLLTLFLVYLRARRKIQPDDVVDRLIAKLVNVVLVEAAAVVFTIVAAQFGAAEVKEITVSTVRVPVTQSIGHQSSEKGGKRASLLIPPRKKACLIAASTKRWTVDPLDGLKFVLSHMNVQIDVTEAVRAYGVAKANGSSFADTYVKDVWEELRKSNLAMGDWAEVGPVLGVWVNGFLVPVLAAAIRSNSNLISIPISDKPGPLSAQNLVAWPRFIAAGFLARNVSFDKIVPTESIEGRSDKMGTSKFPAPNLPVGCLLMQTPDGPARIQVNEIISNTGDGPMLVVFGINDDLPQDNGHGYADLFFDIREL